MRNILIGTWLLTMSLSALAITAFGGGSPSVQDTGLRWSGQVDATVRITIRGRRATTRTITGQQVRAVQYDFLKSLPTRNNPRVNVRKLDGRGSVRMVQQPNRSNNHTAIVEIRDRRAGSDFYDIEVYWDRGNVDERPPSDPGFGRNAEMTWQGRVDDRVRIRVRNRIATAQTISGQRTTGVRYDFRSPLPSRSVVVTVRKRDGRGSVRVIEQPRRSNGYSALVEIRDRSRGSDFYAFELNWNRLNTPIIPGNQSGVLNWKGRVDGRVRISVRSRSAFFRTMSGRRPTEVSYDFRNSLPRKNSYVRVDKRDGRGTVRVIQQPNRLNNYTAIVEITDSRRGSDKYEFDLIW